MRHPVGVLVDGDSAEGVHKRTWQDVAVALDRWQRQLRFDERAEYGARLVQEFIIHLEEEGLAVTGRLDAADVAALERYQAAEKRLVEVIRLASERIHRERDPTQQGRPRGAPAAGFYEHVAHEASWPSTAFFEWRGTHDGLRREPTGSFAIGAGVSWERGNEPREAEHPDW